jgi:hypothetical protein
MRDHHVAPYLLARSFQTLLCIIDYDFSEVISPAALAELMATAEADGLTIWIPLFGKLRITDYTHASMIFIKTCAHLHLLLSIKPIEFFLVKENSNLGSNCSLVIKPFLKKFFVVPMEMP